MKQIIKRIARSRVSRQFTRRWVLDRPIRSIPPILGYIHNIRVPRSVQRLPTRSPAAPANINIVLQLIDSVLTLPGQLAECGVHQGKTLLATGLYLRETSSGKRLLGFDSFEGFDETIATDLALGGDADEATRVDKRLGGFSDTSYPVVQQQVDALGLSDIIQLYPGYFHATFPHVTEREFCFVSIDCDIYESYKQSLEFFYSRLVPGGVLLLDEYNDPPWPGCNKAVDEFLADKPETLEEIESDNIVKYYFRKCG